MRCRTLSRSLAILILGLCVLCLQTGCDARDELRGLYYWGGEVNVVCPCATRTCYWVRAEPTLLKQMKSFVQRHTSRPYQPVYLTYRGRMLDEPGVGFAANYDGYYQIEQALSLSVDLPEDCGEPEHR